MKTVFNKMVFDSISEIISPHHTALIIIDMQNDFCSEGGVFHRNGKDLTTIQTIIPRISSLLEKVRRVNILPIFIQQTTCSEGRSESPAWLRLKTRDGKDPGYTMEGEWGWEIVNTLRPVTGDRVVTKYRSDAFIGTNLELILRCNSIQSVMIVGVITEGCVESTLRSAVHHDYYAVLIEDCVASPNKELHEAALRIMRSRYDVTTAEEIFKILSTVSL